MNAVSFVLQLPDRWGQILASKPETGMSYQVVTLVLSDGRLLERAVVVGGAVDLSSCAAYRAAPFSADEVVAIEVTHDRSGPPTFRNTSSGAS